MTIIEKIEQYHPCPEARKWLGDRTDIAQAWRECPDGRWMIWLLGRLHVAGKIDRETLVLAACAVARLTLRYIPAGENRPRIAIETAEAWCRGEATIKEVRAARAAACAAARAAADCAAAADARAADACAAAYAADAAAYAAAYAADTAAAAAAAAAYAADAAADAADAAADAIRSVVPASVIELALEVES